MYPPNKAEIFIEKHPKMATATTSLCCFSFCGLFGMTFGLSASSSLGLGVGAGLGGLVAVEQVKPAKSRK